VSHEAIDWAVKQEADGNAPRKLILILLANRADDAWVCWPSRRLLAEESGLSVRQVVRHLASLEEDGLIRRVAWERADGGQGANVFALGPTATDAPVTCTTRGGGRVRHGGMTPKTRGEGHTRHPLNPKENSTLKSSVSAAREESRRRSPADAIEAQGDVGVKPNEADLFAAVHAVRTQKPDAYARQIDTIRNRAPRLWKQAVGKARDQFEENEPEKLKNQASVDALTYLYVIRLRGPDWPAWLAGPLLPMIPQAERREAA
jgi:DNA-binding transcriptional ArsR family regulator